VGGLAQRENAAKRRRNKTAAMTRARRMERGNIKG